MEDKIKSEKPKEVKEVVEEKKSTSSKNVTPLLIVLCVLLLFSLIPVFALLSFRYNLRGNYQKCNINRRVICDTRVVDKMEATDTDIESEYVVPEIENKGWALITAPDIKLSAEIPYHEVVTHTFEGKQLESIWTYLYRKTNEYPNKSLGTFEASLHFSFDPLDTKDITCGGSGCANMSSVTINGYKKTGDKTLAILVENFKREVNPNGDDVAIDGKYTSRWGLPVYEYSMEAPGGHSNGYILLNGEFVYHISFFINTQPASAATTANKILNSIKFY